MRPEINNRHRPIIGRLFGADNRTADNRPKHYRCTSSFWTVKPSRYTYNQPPRSTQPSIPPR